MDNGLSREIVTLDPNKGVLILIVMDNGLSRFEIALRRGGGERVLILIVMDNGLSHGNRYAGTVAVLTS